MKRAKVMLSSILVLAVVAGALAFKVKDINVCAYSTTGAVTSPISLQAYAINATTTLTTVSYPKVTRQTVEAANTNYATTFTTLQASCPATSFAIKAQTLTVEN